MRILLWHVHGSWTTAFVQGAHTYLLPTLPERGPDGLGRAQTWDWPSSVLEITPQEARTTDIDLMVLQRPQELSELAKAWTGRTPGREVPAVYLEHSAPEGPINAMAHPAAAHDLTLVHVTHFNHLFWDTGATRSVVIEHGIVDPGHRYRGDLARAAAVINEPVRRARITGTDLLAEFRRVAPVDLFGMGSQPLEGRDLPQAQLHTALAVRRVYLHPYRWTSLGLSLIEAMQLGMPVVALATTEVADAVPADAGVTSTRLQTLTDALRRLCHEPEEAAAIGARARQVALRRFGLKRFLADWDRLLEELVR